MKYNEIAGRYPTWTIDGFGNIDFADYFEAKLINNPLYTVDHLGRITFSYDPWYMRLLVKIREILVLPFGLKTEIPKSETEKLYFEEGSVMVFFHVWKRTPDIIVLEEKDKHLNFRIVLQVRNEEFKDEMVYGISTLVHHNNRLGKIYFTIIKPFHYIIMKLMIKKLRNIL